MLFTHLLMVALFPIHIVTSVREGKTHSLCVTVSDVFVFLGLMLYGPNVAASLAAMDGAVTGIRGEFKKPYKYFFNLSLLPIAAWVSGWCFHLLLGIPPPLVDATGIEDFGTFFAVAGLVSLLFYTINSGGVVVAIALASRRRIADSWRENFFTSALATLAGSSVAAFVFVNLDRGRILSLVVAVPIVVALHYAYRLNTNRINAALAHADQMRQLFHSTISSLAMAIDAKDQYTHGHVNRVQNLVEMIAVKLRLRDVSGESLEGLKAAALLHDIGKLAIPEYILNKPSGLTKWEIQKMRTHPDVGAEILENVPFPYPVVKYVRYHHEKWDGTGYPEGKKGEDIPLGARILSVADCYDALRSDRPYRGAMTRDVALDYIQSLADKSYDPAVVDVLVEHIDEFEVRIAEVEANNPVLPTAVTFSQKQEPPLEKQDISKNVFDDIAQAHREIQAVYEVSDSVGKTLNVSDTLALLVGKIGNLVPFDACAVFLANPHTNQLLPYHTSGELAETLDKLRITVAEGVTGWVAANNQMLANVSPAPDFGSRPELQDAFRSCASLPLALEDRLLGVITVYAKLGSIFQDNHLRLLDTLSRQAAAAVNNAIVYEETQEDAYTDALTGLPNLRYFRVFGDQELRRAKKMSYPVTLLMMDLNAFKAVNDQWGHRIGDRVLIEVSHVLRTQLRKSDTCIRYGGDEFVGLLPGSGKELAEATMSRLRESIADHEILLKGRETLSVGLSVGSATFPEDAKELDLLLALADQAMYQDKLRHSKDASLPASILPFDARGNAG